MINVLINTVVALLLFAFLLLYLLSMYVFVSRNDIDVLCIQESRLTALGPRGCKIDDGQHRQRTKVSTNTKGSRDEADLLTSGERGYVYTKILIIPRLPTTET